MNPRHAAALAFWLILIPITSRGRSDPSAPLMNWRVFPQLFATQKECEATRAEVVEFAGNPSVQNRFSTLMNLPISKEQLAPIFAAEKLAICVGSDDPRLQGK